jgi:hypothetical protein
MGSEPGWSAQAQSERSDSVLAYYRELIAARKNHKSSLVYGRTHFVHERTKNYFAYYRIAQDEVFFVEANLSERALTAPKATVSGERLELVLGNYPAQASTGDNRTFLPYEARMYRVAKSGENTNDA